MIIDFRARPSTGSFLSILQNPIFEEYSKAKGYGIEEHDIDDMVALMDENGIDAAVMQGRDIETTFDWFMANDEVAAAAERTNGKVIGYAGIDPHKGMAAVREVTRCVEHLGLRGVSMDPYMHKIPADHRLFYPIYSKCCELTIPVVLTSGWAYRMPGVVVDDASPRHVDRVATDFPELKIVLSHGGYPYVREIITLAHRHENVYFEFSGMEHRMGSHEYVEAANTLIPDKVLFASAFPFFGFDTMLARYAQLEFTPEVREKVMGKNAAALLGLEVI